MFWSSWSDLARIVILGTLAYLGVILMLRAAGKRLLSKMNAFDFVVTVALGSTLATVLLSKDVALAEGLTALALLIVLQYLIAWLSVRITWLRRLTRSDPTLLFFRGRYLEDAMRRERVTPDSVRAGMRAQGYLYPGQVEAAVLETDGSLTVIGRTQSDRPDERNVLLDAKNTPADPDAEPGLRKA